MLLNGDALWLLLVLALLCEVVGLYASLLVGAELLDEHVVTLLGYNGIRVLLNLEALLLQILNDCVQAKVQLFLYFI